MTRETQLIRSNVHIIENAKGAIYEITDDPNIMKVNIRQTEVWFEGGRLIRSVKELSIDTDCCLYKKGYVLPGNIITVYSLEQVTDDPEEWLLYDEHGELIKTPNDAPIYSYCYYDPNSKYKQTGEIEEQQSLHELTHRSKNDKWYQW